MLLTIGISIVWLLFTLAFFIFSSTHFALLFAIGSLLLWAWLLVSVYAVKSELDCEIMMANETYKNERMGYQLLVRNTSRLPVTHLNIHLIIEHVFTGTQASRHHTVSIPARSMEDFSFILPQNYMGQVNVRIKELTIKDSFSFFRSKRKSNQQSSLLIVPNPYYVKLQRIEQNSHVLQLPGVIPLKKENGEELADLAVYKPGDSVKNIHWKLSTKVDELYVKKHETMIGDSIMMTVDFTSFTNRVALYDEFIETVSALLFSYVAGNHDIQFIVDHSTGQQLKITNEREAANALKELLKKSAAQLTLSDQQWKTLRKTYPNCIVLTTNPARSTEYQTVVISDSNGGSAA